MSILYAGRTVGSFQSLANSEAASALATSERSGAVAVVTVASRSLVVRLDNVRFGSGNAGVGVGVGLARSFQDKAGLR